MPPKETLHESTHSTRLLVSIRDREEAMLAIRHDIHWIDVKEPRTGALGRPTLDSAREIYDALANHSFRSVALGELHELLSSERAYGESLSLAELFPVAKVGMSNLKQIAWRPFLQKLYGDLALRNCQLVPVFYADGADHGATDWNELMQFLDDEQPSGENSSHRRLLIDTFSKDGKNLLDHLPLPVLQQCLEDCQQRKTKLVLAGSLRAKQISKLLNLGAEAIGVRGAVCTRKEACKDAFCSRKISHESHTEKHTRMGSLNSEKLKTIASLFEETSPSTPLGC
jgi:uncharacterized protein (UPF0264 family)